MADIRTRIAAVIAGVMNGTPDSPERWDFLLADAIITELGLRRENVELLHRWVTDWKTDL